MRIRITTSQTQVVAVLNESATAQAVAKQLPFEFMANTWGEELYGSIPIKAPNEPGTLNVEAGDIAFWRPGSALCIFYGPTPASVDEKPVPASEVIPIGKIDGDFSALRNAKPSLIRVEQVEATD